MSQVSIRTQAIGAVQLHFIIEHGRCHKLAYLPASHLVHINKLHVTPHHEGNRIHHRIRIMQSPQNTGYHVASHRLMSGKPDAVIFRIQKPARRLADIVEQRCQHQFQRRLGTIVLQAIQHHHRMDINIALRMPLGRLVATDEFHDFRNDPFDQAALHQHFHSAAAMRRKQDLVKLVTNPLRSNPSQPVGMISDRIPGGRLNIKPFRYRKPHGAHQAKGILPETLLRMTDTTDQLLLQIFKAAHIVDNFPGFGSSNIPLTVKSRRKASSRGDE